MRVNDNVDNNKNDLREQNSDNLSSPNKEASPDQTHWKSGDETDSDWVSSPIRCHDNRTMPKSLPGFTMTKCAGTKRSLFLLDESSQEQLTKRFLGKLSSIVCTYVAMCKDLPFKFSLYCSSYSALCVRVKDVDR